MARGKLVAGWMCGVALAAVAACGEDTGIVVLVDTDLPVPEQVDGIRITVKSSRPQPLVETFDLRAGAARVARPVRVGLRPADPDKPPTVLVEATALRGPIGGALEVVHNRAELSFRKGKVYTVSLPLNAACNPVRCPLDHTCTANGQCVPVGSGGRPPGDLDGGADAGGGHDGPATAGDGPAPTDGGTAAEGAPIGDAALGADASIGGPSPAPDVAPPTPGKDAASPPVDTGSPPPVDTAQPPLDTAPPPVDAAPPPDVPAVKRPVGASCQAVEDCQSSACVDGVCCDGPCSGRCHSCRAAETGAANGRCAPVAASRDPDNECAAESPAGCGFDGACDGQGACRQYGADTQCAPAACSSSSSFSPARSCGGGACQPAALESCGRFVCTPQGCPTACEGHAQCAADSYCEGTVCVGRKGLGSSCRSDRECDVTLGLGCLLGLCTL